MAAHVRTVQVPEADRRELKRRGPGKGAPGPGGGGGPVGVLGPGGGAGEERAPGGGGGGGGGGVRGGRGRGGGGRGGARGARGRERGRRRPGAVGGRVGGLPLAAAPDRFGGPRWSPRLRGGGLAMERATFKTPDSF